MKEKQTKLWVPLYVDKWIFGSTRIELEPAERGVFIDLMALAAKDEGFIRANETTPYLHVQIAGLLNIPVDLLQSTIAKSIHFGKLEEPVTGIYRISKWEDYQFSDDYRYRLGSGRRQVPGPVRQNSDNSPKSSAEFGPIRKDRTGQDKTRDDKNIGTRPTLEQVREYCKERGNAVNPERWFSHYESNGWRVGRNPMKDWRAAVRTWEHSSYDPKPQAGAAAPKAGKYDNIGGKV